MKLDPAIRINLSHSDLQKIYDRALDKVKNTSNKAIEVHLHPISCIITAFVDYVNQHGNCIDLSQPERLPYNLPDED